MTREHTSTTSRAWSVRGPVFAAVAACVVFLVFVWSWATQPVIESDVIQKGQLVTLKHEDDGTVLDVQLDPSGRSVPVLSADQPVGIALSMTGETIAGHVFGQSLPATTAEQQQRIKIAAQGRIDQELFRQGQEVFISIPARPISPIDALFRPVRAYFSGEPW